jgi:hypothetical protein
MFGEISGEVNAGEGNGQVVSQGPSSATDLRDFKNVTNRLIQDALAVWAELWAELEGHGGPNGTAREADGKFEPSCGWTEYLEKMWVLKHYLDFTKRLSQQ